MEEYETKLTAEVPLQIIDSEILYFLHSKEINSNYLNAIKKLTDYNDEVIADWLNLSVKTYREYRKPNSIFKENIKEHILLLLALMQHGINVFVSAEAFEQWLITTNFHFDNSKPTTFLNTITGIKFVDDRLTAIEIGDNV
jgi:uncharacterized protein (DUF2384 family)